MEIEASLRDAFGYALDAIRKKGVWVIVVVWILFQGIGLYFTREFLPVQCQHCDNPPCRLSNTEQGM